MAGSAREDEGVSDEVLTLRALNRATLARQFLLKREARDDWPVVDVVSHLVGMQAQLPLDPYTGLWSRLAEFGPDDLARPLIDRELVRIVLMRGTIHLVTADDALEIRPLVQPILDREMRMHGQHKEALAATDARPIVAAMRGVLADAPLNGNQLRSAIAARFPDVDAAAMALACRNHLALVQVPPRGVWGRSLGVTVITAESWLGRPQSSSPSIDALLLRYFGAFGPATVADAASWSGLTGMREVVERLRPLLRTFRNERGQELFDLPDAPRPDPSVPAPVRFLPTYDNVLLSHADRSRFVDDAERKAYSSMSSAVLGAVLHDGRMVGTWSIERDREVGRATLLVDQMGSLTKRAAASITAEGRRLLTFHEPALPHHDIRFTSAASRS
ncbi:MAG: Winged helix DNA-binding protein [Acidimicrobiales bacterium]|nr:Winged helix DNA-binding protein [Acidimicrobiales bacterium]